MAWLLHEPRLISSVPVFCIMAIKPLIINHSAPVFVSTGAVRLLKYLHTRLEALLPEIIASTTNNNSNNSMKSAGKGSNNALYDAEEENELVVDTGVVAGVGTGGDNSGAVWKKCWVPILQSMAEGIVDDREEVRQACGSTLCEAILDRHSDYVPLGVLIDLLAHLLTPVIRILGDYLIADWHKHCLNQLHTTGTTASTSANAKQFKLWR